MAYLCSSALRQRGILPGAPFRPSGIMIDLASGAVTVFGSGRRDLLLLRSLVEPKLTVIPIRGIAIKDLACRQRIIQRNIFPFAATGIAGAIALVIHIGLGIPIFIMIILVKSFVCSRDCLGLHILEFRLSDRRR